MSPADSPEFGQQLHEAPAFGHTPVAFVPPPGDHERIDAAARAILAGDKGLFDVEFAAGDVPGPTILIDPPANAIAHPTLRFLVGNVPVGRRALTGEERAELVRRVGPDKN